MKGFIRFLFRIFGFEIQRRQLVKNVIRYNDQMGAGLERFKKLGFPINTIVDVGAAQGLWSLSAKAFWPDASFLLFEPLDERVEELQNIVAANTGFYHVPRAAGRNEGIIYFSVSPDLDGSGVASDPFSSQVRTVQVSSIQEEVQKLRLKGPFIIKLDTHGFEVPIIEGCEEILNDVSLFVIECYGFNITSDSLLFWEMCSHLNNLGFRLFDVVDIMHRPKDEAFWQCDAFFIPKHHPIFQDNRYS